MKRKREAPAKLVTVGVNTSKLLKPEDVAGITGLSIETLAQWRSQRRGIPYLKLARNCVRYRQSDLDTWLEQRIVPVQTETPSARRES